MWLTEQVFIVTSRVGITSVHLHWAFYTCYIQVCSILVENWTISIAPPLMSLLIYIQIFRLFPVLWQGLWEKSHLNHNCLVLRTLSDGTIKHGVCYVIHRNVIHRFMVQPLQDPLLCGSTLGTRWPPTHQPENLYVFVYNSKKLTTQMYRQWCRIRWVARIFVYFAVIIAKNMLCFCVQKYTSENLLFLGYLIYILSRRVSC
jgi:hypothetical protein